MDRLAQGAGSLRPDPGALARSPKAQRRWFIKPRARLALFAALSLLASSLWLAVPQGTTAAAGNPGASPQISVGDGSACSINAAGGVQCWGLNHAGQLGDGTTADHSTPVTVSGLASGAKAVSVGKGETVCALTFLGSVKCWGYNGSGQLGNGNSSLNQSAVPVQVSGLTTGITAVSVGSSHACALTSSGGVKCWGDNFNGELGTGVTGKPSSVPVDVLRQDPYGNPYPPFVAVSAGGDYTCALGQSGDVYCWGGFGSNELVPRRVFLHSGVTATAVAVSEIYWNICVITSAGGVMCGDLWNFGGTAVGVSGPSDAVSVSAGSRQACALDRDGSVWCLSNGATSATQVSGLPPGVLQISTAAGSSGSDACAILQNKRVMCWGSNPTGSLGDNTTTDRSSPGYVLTPARGVSEVSAGGLHTCSVDVSGAAACWGNNSNGQLGDGTTATADYPSDVSGITQGATAISAGGNHSCALAPNSGKIVPWCWGDNTHGQAGAGSSLQSLTPQAVQGFTQTAAAISAGDKHTCAIGGGGKGECWGLNIFGQAGVFAGGSASGLNYPPQTSSPQMVTSLPTATAVSAGGNHTCALASNSSGLPVPWCWGENSRGQLGTGPGPYQNAAAQVPGFATATAVVSSGMNHSCAVTAAGVLECWGDNSLGQLGNANAAGNGPVAVALGSTVTSVSAGGNHTCAVTSLGALWCWGDSSLGEVGNNMTSTATPPSLIFPSGVLAVSSGTLHTCALLAGQGLPFGGAVKCWGDNTDGEVGDNSTTQRNAPVDSMARFTLAERTAPLTIFENGLGGGEITSDPPGLDCGAYCAASFDQYTRVTLTVAPDPYSAFGGWSGACSGTAVTCSVVADSAKSVNASLLKTADAVHVTLQGTGTGNVSSDPPGINCGATCTTGFTPGSHVTLIASPDPKVTFDGWNGDCAGSTSTVCELSLDSHKYVGATFTKIVHAITVSLQGTGHGFAGSVPYVTQNNFRNDCDNCVFCPSTCTALFDEGTVVTLRFTSFSDSVFSGWSGDCAGRSASCVLTADMDHYVEAAFDLTTATVTVTKMGTGGGTVSSSPSGIDCGDLCSVGYRLNSEVTLTASPDQNSLFTRWQGDCVGRSPICNLTLDTDKVATPVFTAITHTVTALKTGAGGGNVTSYPGGIDCGTSCSSYFSQGSNVTLTATPAADSTFLGWSGACSGADVCVLSVGSDRIATANFGKAGLALSVSGEGSGQGSISSDPSGIDCGTTCFSSFPQGSRVTLTAAPAAGSAFTGWAGDCLGSGSCNLYMDGDHSAAAIFELVTHTVSVSISGKGSGTVGSDPEGISCGQTCSFGFDSGQEVTLAAAPSAGSVFAGWSGDCVGTVPCTLAADKDRRVIATFDLAKATPATVPAGQATQPPPAPSADLPTSNTAGFASFSGFAGGLLPLPFGYSGPPPQSLASALAIARALQAQAQSQSQGRGLGLVAGSKGGNGTLFIVGKNASHSGQNSWAWMLTGALTLAILLGIAWLARSLIRQVLRYLAPIRRRLGVAS